ncbi:hypothetical protein CEXT_654961 [Caerostris extrusa]|uniref:Uncharacterized protein n=1 Tax=Caerostris extrusa TaxID=172846 RepID=A0AAV4QK76_CAEEX|nr:hypothetical protein CEXT_654961 [Caerostris extrusa]
MEESSQRSHCRARPNTGLRNLNHVGNDCAPEMTPQPTSTPRSFFLDQPAGANLHDFQTMMPLDHIVFILNPENAALKWN